jgi:hypothetical protein
MDLRPHVERLRHEFMLGAELGGDEARDLAQRLSGSLESAIRLGLLDALSAAADEITRELAPGSAELRLRAGEPDFVVTLAPVDEPAEAEAIAAPPPAETDEGTTARINLRLPEGLKAGIEQAAGRERLSVNAWLVRVLATAVAHGDHDQSSPRPRKSRVGQSYSGWVQ